MTALLTDIGGTHMRVAQAAEGDIQSPEKFIVADFASLPAILNRYCAGHGLEPSGTVRIATAANAWADGKWHFTNNPDILLDPDDFVAAGWSVDVLADDFLASAHGLETGQTVVLRAGEPLSGAPEVLLGPGTGLGLAYIVHLASGGRHVQQTYGGHMLAAAATDEQRRVLDLIAASRGNRGAVIPENVASGRNLPGLYRAVASLRGDPVEDGPASLAFLLASSAPAATDTLRLFHEFLGLFAHQAVVTLHAFGGVTLDGGIVQALRRADRFNLVAFRQGFEPDLVPVVRDALVRTPIRAVEDPFMALRGLQSLGRTMP